MHFSSLMYMSHALHISTSLFRSQANNIWWWVQITKLPIIHYSVVFFYFLPLRCKYLSRYIFLKRNLNSFLNVRDQVSHPYKPPGKVIVFCILTSVILETKQEDKWYWIKQEQVFPELSPRNFFMNAILICLGCSQIFELYHILKGFITHLWVIILPCIVFRCEHILFMYC